MEIELHFKNRTVRCHMGGRLRWEITIGEWYMCVRVSACVHGLRTGFRDGVVFMTMTILYQDSSGGWCLCCVV